MASSTYYSTIDWRLSRLLESLHPVFSSDERKEVTEFIDVGEYGIALETLMAIVSEEEKSISDHARDEIQALASLLGVLES